MCVEIPKNCRNSKNCKIKKFRNSGNTKVQNYTCIRQKFMSCMHVLMFVYVHVCIYEWFRLTSMNVCPCVYVTGMYESPCMYACIYVSCNLYMYEFVMSLAFRVDNTIGSF